MGNICKKLDQAKEDFIYDLLENKTTYSKIMDLYFIEYAIHCSKGTLSKINKVVKAENPPDLDIANDHEKSLADIAMEAVIILPEKAPKTLDDMEFPIYKPVIAETNSDIMQESMNKMMEEDQEEFEKEDISKFTDEELYDISMNTGIGIDSGTGMNTGIGIGYNGIVADFRKTVLNYSEEILTACSNWNNGRNTRANQSKHNATRTTRDRLLEFIAYLEIEVENEKNDIE